MILLLSRSQVYIMTTILEEPYMMRAKPKKGESLVGNDQYEGYCKVQTFLLSYYYFCTKYAFSHVHFMNFSFQIRSQSPKYLFQKRHHYLNLPLIANIFSIYFFSFLCDFYISFWWNCISDRTRTVFLATILILEGEKRLQDLC